MTKRKILKNKTLIIGCSSLGATIANKFSKEGKNIIVLDKDPKSFDALSENFSGNIVQGDATDIDSLVDAGIASSKEIVVCTDDDNINIYVAHIARRIYDVPNIYIHLLHPENEILIKLV